MAGIGQCVVHIAIERHITLGIEADCTTERNHCANIMIVTEMPPTGEASTLESATQDNVVEGGAIPPYLQVFHVVGVTSDKVIEFK